MSDLLKPAPAPALDRVSLRSPAGDLEAAFVPSASMAGVSLRHRGDELLGLRQGLAAYVERGETLGIPLLHPWANRLSAEEAGVAGRTIRLAAAPFVQREEHGLPIHGLLAGRARWTVTGAGARDLRAELDFGAEPALLEAFPFPHRLAMDVALAPGELAVTATVLATGDVPVPIAFGFHPYLRLPGVPRADWRVALPAMRHLELDGSGLPTHRFAPARAWRGTLGRRTFDDAFTEVPEGARFELEGGGRRIAVTFESGFPVAQVFAPADDDVVAFEPMTAPVDALVHHDGLPLLPPGQRFRARFSIAVHDSPR